MNRLDLVVGPNGAGKSTFIAFTLAPLLPGSPVVNADEIARRRWPEDPASHAYDAARVAADTRARLIELGRSFIAETVFSHPSKPDLIRTARAEDFTVVLHVLLVPEDLAVERVRHRVRAGGHDVPEAKVRQRHRRLWGPVAEALALADLATVYDGSRLRGPRIVARLSGGQPVGSPHWPAWSPEILRSRWV
ncbi:ATPase [Mycobacterium sp. E2699]|uniref:AAA family ATPase n=1 Tax=Mycobacterium sp. E2699 TaxID=1834137 RepID=UPI0007FB719F|nr:AAA family ATPase [Mycobacterium sp. E2699]OBH07853.1 ATPase [Mycobacterium sp. E2699]